MARIPRNDMPCSKATLATGVLSISTTGCLTLFGSSSANCFLLRMLSQLTKLPRSRILLRGSFVSCDSILNKKQLAELLPKSVKQPVVEMESTPVARVAFEHGISFLGIRAISDPWDEELSFSISEFCDDEMRIRAPRVFTTILRRPYIIPQLIRLARNSRKAAKSLGEAVEQLLRQL